MSDDSLGGIWFELEAKSGTFNKEMDDAEKRYKNVKEAAERLGETMTKVGTAFFLVGGAITGALALASRSAGELGDNLDEMSARTGMTTKGLQELGYAATLSGSSIEEIEVGIKKMSGVVTDAKAGVEGATKALGLLGISAKDLAGLSPDEQFNKIAIAISKMPDPLARAASAVDIFGRSGTSLLPVFASGEAGMAKMRTEAAKYSNILSVDGVKSAVAYADQMDNLKMSIAALWQLIGSSVMPVMSGLRNSFQSGILAVKNFATEYPVLTSAITSFVIVIVSLVAGFGGLLLITAKVITSYTSMLPVITKLTPAVSALWGVIAAHPFVAIVAAIGLAVTALGSWLVAEQDAKNAAINTGKTITDRIKMHNDEIAVLKAKIESGKLDVAERAAAQQRISLIEQAILFEKKRAEEEKQLAVKKTADVVDETAQKNQAATEKGIVAEMAALKTKKEEHDKYYMLLVQMGEVSLAQQRKDLEQEISQVDKGTVRELELKKKLYDVETKMAEGATYTIKGGWDKAMKAMGDAQLNWGDAFTGVFGSVKTGMATGMSAMILTGQNFGDTMGKIADGLKEAFVNMATKMAAEWIMQHAIMKAASLAWKMVEVGAAAAVAAAKAAAASAWSLFGAIAIGLALGAAVMGFAGKFATGGIVGGDSYTGDNVLAAVNSREMILNDRQQATLFNMANGNGPSGAGGINLTLTVPVTIQGGVDKNNVKDIVNQITEGVKAGGIEFARMVKAVTKEGGFRTSEAY